MPTSSPSTEPPPHLTRVAADTERQVAEGGWDQPPRMFALVRNDLLSAREPALADRLRGVDPEGFTAVEQEGLPRTSDVGSLLGRVAWPEEVTGAALAIERIVVPPEAERDLSSDSDEAAAVLTAHPGRRDVRLVVAVTRDGGSVCLLRQREHDTADAVAIGTDLAPGLVQALDATLRD